MNLGKVLICIWRPFNVIISNCNKWVITLSAKMPNGLGRIDHNNQLITLSLIWKIDNVWLRYLTDKIKPGHIKRRRLYFESLFKQNLLLISNVQDCIIIPTTHTLTHTHTHTHFNSHKNKSNFLLPASSWSLRQLLKQKKLYLFFKFHFSVHRYN